jgi:hypothetical protein
MNLLLHVQVDEQGVIFILGYLRSGFDLLAYLLAYHNMWFHFIFLGHHTYSQIAALGKCIIDGLIKAQEQPDFLRL